MKLPGFICGKTVEMLERILDELESACMEDICPSYADAKRTLKDTEFWREEDE